MVTRKQMDWIGIVMIAFMVTAHHAASAPGRIHITQADLSPGMTISTPGSYIVTESLHATGAVAAITVAANHVSIDLNGHAIRGSATAPHAIAQAVGVQRTTVRNGSIEGFIQAGNAAVSLPGGDSVVESVRFLACRNALQLGSYALARDLMILGGPPLAGDSVGVLAGDYARLVRVEVRGVSVSGVCTGMDVGERSVITQCRVLNNTAGTPFTGIRAGPHSVVSASDVRDNTGSLLMTGLASGSNSVVHAAGVSRNQAVLVTAISLNGPGVVADSTASQNAGSGIQAGPGAMVVDNVAHSNALVGILLNGDSYALRNQITLNGLSAIQGAGVIAGAPGNRIEANTALRNRTGIRLNTTNNLVIANHTSLNTTTNILVTVTPNHVGLRRALSGTFEEKNGMANLDY